MRSMKTEDFNSEWKSAFSVAAAMFSAYIAVLTAFPDELTAARVLQSAFLAASACALGYGIGVRRASRRCFKRHPKIEELDSQTLRAIAYLMDADGFVRVEPYSDMAHALEELRTMELADKTEDSPYGRWFATMYLRKLAKRQKRSASPALEKARETYSVDEIGDFKRVG